MRFMILLKATKETEAGTPPSKESFEAMAKYNEQLVKAGVLLAAEGLHPSPRGARVRVQGDKRTVVDGPFTETKEIIGGYALMEMKSKAEALEYARKFMDLHRQHWPEFEGECEVRPLEDNP